MIDPRLQQYLLNKRGADPNQLATTPSAIPTDQFGGFLPIQIDPQQEIKKKQQEMIKAYLISKKGEKQDTETGDIGAALAGLGTQLSQAGSQMATVPIGTRGLWSPTPTDYLTPYLKQRKLEMEAQGEKRRAAQGERALDLRERGVDLRERGVAVQEGRLETEKQGVGLRSKALGLKERGYEIAEKRLEQGEKRLGVIEEGLGLRKESQEAKFSKESQDYMADINKEVITATKPHIENRDLADRALILLEQGNPSGLGLAVSVLSKSIGKEAGVLTNQDIARAAGTGRGFTFLKRELNQLLSGNPISDEAQKELKTLVQIIKKDEDAQVEAKRTETIGAGYNRYRPTFERQGVTIEDVRSSIVDKPEKRIKVRIKETGQRGSVLESEFDSNIMERIY